MYAPSRAEKQKQRKAALKRQKDLEDSAPATPDTVIASNSNGSGNGPGTGPADEGGGEPPVSPINLDGSVEDNEEDTKTFDTPHTHREAGSGAATVPSSSPVDVNNQMGSDEKYIELYKQQVVLADAMKQVLAKLDAMEISQKRKEGNSSPSSQMPPVVNSQGHSNTIGITLNGAFNQHFTTPEDRVKRTGLASSGNYSSSLTSQSYNSSLGRERTATSRSESNGGKPYFTGEKDTQKYIEKHSILNVKIELGAEGLPTIARLDIPVEEFYLWKEQFELVVDSNARFKYIINADAEEAWVLCNGKSECKDLKDDHIILRQWEEAFISALTTLQQAILNHIPPKLRDALILEMKQAGDKYNVIKRLGFRSSIVRYYNKSPFYQDPHGLMQLLVKRFDLKDNIRLRNAVTMFETLVFNKDEDPRLMYSEFKRALLHVINVLPKHTLTEEYICASFIRRLPQSIYARVISEMDRESTELLTVDVMLHKLAAEYEYNKQNKTRSPGAVAPIYSPGRGRHNQPALAANVTQVKTKTPVEQTSKVGCYSCGEPGHYANNCPKRKFQMNRVNMAEEGMEYQEDSVYSDTDVQENEGEDQTDAADEDEGVYNVVEVDTSEYRDNRKNVGNSITTISQTGSHSVVGQIIHPDDPEFLTLLANAIVLEHVNVIEEIISDGEVVASVFQRRLGASGIHEGIVDGGSQIHCTGVDSILYDKTRLQEPIYVNGVGGQRVVTIVGKILIKLNHGKGLFLTGVRYIPGFHSTIISVTQLQKSGVEVITANNSCYLVEKQLVQRLDLSERNKQVLLHVPQRAGLYKLKLGEKPIASLQKGILVDKEDVKQVKQTLEEASTKLPRVQKKESRSDSDVEAENDPERSSAEMRRELMQRRLTRSQSQAIARGSNSAANGASKQHNVNGNRAASEEKSHSQGSVHTVEEVNTVMEEQVHVVKQKDNFSADPNVNEYHCRLAHPSAKSLLLFAKKFGLDKLTEVLKLMKKKNNCSCEVCITTRIPSELQIGKRNARRSPLADRRMHTWHVDLIGPFSTIEKDGKRYNLPSIHGHRFALVAIDEQARYIFVIPLQCKSDAPKKLIELIKQKQVEFGMTLVVLRTDKGGEFTSEELAAFLSANGTEHAFSPTDTPQYNGLVERANQTLIRDAKSMLEQCGGSQALWSYALTYAATIHNMMPIPSLHGIVPAEEMYGAERIEEIKRHLPRYQTFGCNVYVHQHKDEHGKFQPHKIPGVYLGWNEEKRYYRVLINTNNRLQVIEAHDVSFIDTTFDQLAEWNNAIRMRSEQMVGINSGNEIEYEVEAIYADRQTKSGKEYLVKWTGYHYPTWEPEKGLTNCTERLKEYHGLRKTPIRSGDMVYNLAEPTRAETSKDSKSTESYHGGSVDVPLDYVEPKTFKAAMADKYKIYWLMAIREEINSLLMLNVFSPIKSYPIGRKPLTTTWVLKVKRDKDNKVIRWKARLVVQGFLQKYGIDFTETHSPTGRMKVIKYVIATAAKYNLEIKQIDYDVAFLNATLPEEVLITIPDGFELGDGVRSMGYCACLKLNKALYGLKQAPREWNKEIDGFLRSIGYSATTLDECLYFKRVGNKKIYLTLFVDDTLAVYPKEIENVWEEDKKAISQRYKIKDIGDCEWIFNMHLVRDRAKRTITLSQEAYMDKMLKEYGFSDEVRTVSTPFQYSDVSQIEKDCPEEELRLLTPAEQMEYRSKIGSLLYAANITRVDLQYIIGTLARYLTSPLVRHMKAVNHVLRYVGSTKQYKLRFDYSDERQRQGCKLVIYTDSNWAQESEDKKSTGGWLATLNGAIVAWQSKKQSTVALSSTEAEYYALTEAVKECLFLRQLFAEYDLNNGEDISIDIKCDNRGAIEMSDHATDHNRSKHIDIKHHFIRQCVHDKLVRVSYIETKKQLADILTKSVKVGTYQQLLKMIYSEEKE